VNKTKPTHQPPVTGNELPIDKPEDLESDDDQVPTKWCWSPTYFNVISPKLFKENEIQTDETLEKGKDSGPEDEPPSETEEASTTTTAATTESSFESNKAVRERILAALNDTSKDPEAR